MSNRRKPKRFSSTARDLDLLNPDIEKVIMFIQPGGQTDAGRYLIVFFIYKSPGSALVLSARDMDSKERRRYEHK